MKTLWYQWPVLWICGESVARIIIAGPHCRLAPFQLAQAVPIAIAD
jgi:hypothetical protein